MRTNFKFSGKLFSASTFLLCGLTLLFILSACSMGGTSNSNILPGAKQATPTPKVVLTTYQAKTFSIGYPSPWTATDERSYVTSVPGAEQARFDEESSVVLVQAVPDRANYSTSKYLTAIITSNNAVLFKTPQPMNLPATVRVGNESWLQEGFTGDAGSNGVKLPEKLICLANHHNQNNYLFSICLQTPTGSLGRDPAIDSKFQAMLNSFQFK